MATNGEIVYNLPFAAGLYYFILSLTYKGWKKYLYFLITTSMGLAAACIKLHGFMFFIFMAIFYLLYYPYFKNKFTKKYFFTLIIPFIAFLIILTIDYSFTKAFAPALISSVKGKLIYASVKGLNPFIFIFKFFHRQGMLVLWHFLLWVPGIIYITYLFKKKFKTDYIEESSIFIFFTLTYLMIFAVGSHLYFHYFMASYPALCLMCSHSSF